MTDFSDPESQAFQTGGDVGRLSVSISVSSDSLNPSAITELLGVPPTFAAKKGSQRQSGSSIVTQPTGVWLYGFGEASSEWVLEDAIEALLGRLTSDLAVWAALRGEHRIRLSCGLHLDAWNRGCELSSALLRKLADRGLALDLDIYCVSENSVDD